MFALINPTEKECYLYPGHLLVADKPHIVTTVLGSCVSVCLWNIATKTGGINHYMLPVWDGDREPSFKYGDIAIRELIERMLRKINKKNLIAKIFGGARVLQIGGQSGFLEIGSKNIKIAEDILKSYDIPIVSSDVGGNMGRKIIFHTDTGDVFVKKSGRDFF